jgi:predicted GNAT family acetyltransferase
MSSVSVRKETPLNGGRYVATVEGAEGEAELVFSIRSPTLISADHTGAPQSLRGTGAAAALVEYMIDDARTHGFKIVPLCPYVLAQYRRHPEWSDVIAPGP